MTFEEYASQLEDIISAARTAMGSYPFSDLVSLAITIRARNEHLEAEVTRLRTELADVLEVAIARGGTLGYSDEANLARWEELTGREWDDEDGDE